MLDDQKESVNNGKDEIASEYANNILLEPGNWDLKIFFGQWYEQDGIDWHTAVTLPWPQIKILIYYLRVNLAIFENSNGPVKVPKNALPRLPEPPGDGDENKWLDDQARQYFKDLENK